MIKIETRSEHRDGARHVRLSVTGHASGMNGSGVAVPVAVCAGVSALVVGLLYHVQTFAPEADTLAGNNGKDHDGLVEIVVSPEFFVELDFVLRTLTHLDELYPGYIEWDLEPDDEITEPGGRGTVGG